MTDTLQQNTDSPYGRNVISAEGLLQPSQPATLPQPPASTPITLNTITPTTSTLPDYLQTYLAGDKPVDETQTYNDLSKGVGMDEKTQKVNDLQSQLDAITAGQKVDELKLPGEGINVAGANARSITMERDNAIRAIPIQAQLLAAQGNLKAAQDKLDTVFKIKSDYNTKVFNYNNDLRKSVYDYATNEQKIKLDKQAKDEQRTYDLQKNNLDNAQAISKSAMDAGQADIAAEITKLDPKSTTFIADLAKLQTQIKPKPSKVPTENTIKSGSLIIPESAIAQGQSYLEASRGEPYINESGQHITPTGVDAQYVNTKKYLGMLDAWVNKDRGLLQDFFTQYPPKDYLNPNDQSVPKYIHDKLKIVKSSSASNNTNDQLP